MNPSSSQDLALAKAWIVGVNDSIHERDCFLQGALALGLCGLTLMADVAWKHFSSNHKITKGAL